MLTRILLAPDAVALRRTARRYAVWCLAALASRSQRIPGRQGRRSPHLAKGAQCLAAMWQFHRDAARIARAEFPNMTTGRHAIPFVRGDEQEVWRALGFLSAWSHAFSMDLTRSMTQGSAAELLGDTWLDSDERQRRLGVAHYAAAIARELPPEQVRLLESYADGVNVLLSAAVPWEYVLLGRHPRPWRPLDSVLAAQSMFSELTDPAVASLAPRLSRLGTEHDGDSLLSGGQSATVTVQGEERAADAAGIDRLRQVLLAARHEPAAGETAGGTWAPWTAPPLAAGSNSWAVSGERCPAHKAILANDIHLQLASPGPLLFVRCQLAGTVVHGFVRPGIPVIAAGATANVAWGLTRLCGRSSEWVHTSLAGGVCAWREETVGAGASRRQVPVVLTGSGPVLTQRGDVLRWTALEPGAVDFALAKLPWCKDAAEACAAAAAAGSPPMSFLAVDRLGHIGWTVTGRLLLARDDGHKSELLPPAQTPRVLDPHSGFLVTANHDLGVPAPGGRPVVTNPYPPSRAGRIAAVVRAKRSVSPAAMARLQADVDASFYLRWRDLLLPHAGHHPAAAAALRAWDGTARPAASGLHHLILLHLLVRDGVLGPLASPDGPLSQSAPGGLDDELAVIVASRDERLVPPGHADWDAFLRWCVGAAARYLEKRLGPRAHTMRWGEVNRARIRHPLSSRIPRLAWAVDQPEAALPGCSQSVNVSGWSFGAAMRMVACPATGDLIVAWPGGQSGDPLSAGHGALYVKWLKGKGVHMDLTLETA
jgi:penicillin G amidase